MRLRQDELTVYIYFSCVRLNKSNKKPSCVQDV